MDLKDKYLKYKTKYLELKNIKPNDQIGGDNNILFILFNGFRYSKKYWNINNFKIDLYTFRQKYHRNSDTRFKTSIGQLFEGKKRDKTTIVRFIKILEFEYKFDIYNRGDKDYDKLIKYLRDAEFAFLKDEYNEKKYTDIMNRTIEKAEKMLGRGFFEQ